MVVIVLIRKMTQADLLQVCAIERDIFSEPWSEEDFNTSLQDSNNNYIVVEIDGVIAAYCGYWGIAGEGYIYNVAVMNEYRRQHIGYRMLKVLLDEATGRDITSFTLEVRYSNEAAIRLYESLGFHKAGIRKNFYSKPREDAVIMWLKPIQQFPL
jgi:ribosomal-protein-alanine N-acetyltransferase